MTVGRKATSLQQALSAVRCSALLGDANLQSKCNMVVLSRPLPSHTRLCGGSSGRKADVSYRHLDAKERVIIANLHDQGLSAPKIARHLKRHRSTI